MEVQFAIGGATEGVQSGDGRYSTADSAVQSVRLKQKADLLQIFFDQGGIDRERRLRSFGGRDDRPLHRA